MNSREKILDAIRAGQPAYTDLPVVENFMQPFTDVAEKFKMVLTSIGGNVYESNDAADMIKILKQQFNDAKRIVSVPDEFSPHAEIYNVQDDPHKLEDVDVAIIKAHFAVAENGSVWVTEDQMVQRALPFICQHLAIIIKQQHIVASMHDAYDIINNMDYDFGTFIAGPSKTADIEQSLVLGAHGPKTLTVFLTQ
jgi:L-lactate dehydrogenase complex protein LldG